jgi:NAD(P)-dependent dehydrogenase (short-subunit alcohol dehydrogenase family)
MSRIAVITGATGGLGAEVASILVRDGWNLVLLSRSEASARPVVERLAREHRQNAIEVVPADLSDQDSIATAATHIGQKRARLDALFNVAGVLLGTHQVSRHGNEMHFQVNTIAPYLLSRLLWPQLAAAPRGVVLNVSSGSIALTGRLRVDELRQPKSFRKLTGPYAQSKLALTTLTNALDRTQSGPPVILRSMDPGPNQTKMTAGSGMPRVMLWLRPLVFGRPEKGAEAIVGSALDPQFSSRSGLYIAGNRIKRPPPDADNIATQDQLLALCSELTGV